MCVWICLEVKCKWVKCATWMWAAHLHLNFRLLDGYLRLSNLEQWKWGRICSLILYSLFWQDLWHIWLQRPSAPGVNLPEDLFLDTLKKDSRDSKRYDLWNQERSISRQLAGSWKYSEKQVCRYTTAWHFWKRSRLRYSNKKKTMRVWCS